MSEQFSFLGNKCKAAIAAMSLSVLLLLPASLGYGEGRIVEEAFGQLELIPPPNGEPEVGGGGGEQEEDSLLYQQAHRRFYCGEV